MAHPSRTQSAERLARELTEFDAQIVYDPDPTGQPNALRTARRAWRAYDRAATHHLVVQDDVQLPHGFANALVQAIELRPSTVFNLWNEWTSLTGQAVRLATLTGANWAPMSDKSMVAVAVVMPTCMAQEFANYLQHYDGTRDSAALFDFVESTGEPSLTTAPCLVQHDDPVSSSLWRLNLDQGPRRAASYVSPVDARTLSNDDVVRFDSLPCLPADTLRASVAEPSGDGYVIRNAFDYLHSLGETRESLCTRFYDEVLYRTATIQKLVAPAHIFHVWLTSLLMGYELCRSYGQPLIVDSAPAQRSLISLFVGGLKRVLSISALEDLRDFDVSWLMDGVRAGYSVAVRCDRSAEASGSVTIPGST